VRDNGAGISPTDLPNIFLPFYKGSDTGDTGIGLSTVAKIIKLYGGEITAYNDGGACFEFTMPDWTDSS
jgi:signal transduction histidine kinase